jgi:caa(3)-type oxidase subunit IV
MSDATTIPASPAPASPATIAPSVDVEHVMRVRKQFLRVYGVLVVGTVLTVAMYYVYFEEMWQTVTVAMLIASVKGSCVAAVFMHLWHAQKSLRVILLYTGVVVVGLFALSVYSIFSVPAPHYFVR